MKRKEQQMDIIQGDGSGFDDVCFIVSPIGKEGTENYNRFKDVLDYIIKPALDSSSMRLKIIRADDINRSGSFIKDILQHLYSSFIVIVDLTDQNPNVFYELGVRHSLSPRTILIGQKLDDIPSDLREYRTIIYDTSAKGSHNFTKKLHEFISDIKKEPQRPDNPVLDRLSDLIDKKQNASEIEIANLKSQLSSILSKPIDKKQNMIERFQSSDIKERIDRITNLMRGDRQHLGGNFTRLEKGETKGYTLPGRQGKFELYFLFSKDRNNIDDFVYIFVDMYSSPNIEAQLADLRVLMERCSEGQNADVRFIIATDIDLSKQKVNIIGKFNKIKGFLDENDRKYFSLELWDKTGLFNIEKELGLRI